VIPGAATAPGIVMVNGVTPVECQHHTVQNEPPEGRIALCEAPGQGPLRFIGDGLQGSENPLDRIAPRPGRADEDRDGLGHGSVVGQAQEVAHRSANTVEVLFGFDYLEKSSGILERQDLPVRRFLRSGGGVYITVFGAVVGH
jgi:hypothetical protein